MRCKCSTETHIMLRVCIMNGTLMVHTQRNVHEASQPYFQLAAIPEVLQGGHRAVQQSAASRHIN